MVMRLYELKSLNVVIILPHSVAIDIVVAQAEWRVYNVFSLDIISQNWLKVIIWSFHFMGKGSRDTSPSCLVLWP